MFRSMFLSGVAAAVLVLATPALLDTSAVGAQGKLLEHSKKVKHAYRVNRIRPADCWNMPSRWDCARNFSAFGFAGPGTGPGSGPGGPSVLAVLASWRVASPIRPGGWRQGEVNL